MSRVNLLPSEIKKGQENRRRFMLFLLAGIAIVLLVFAFWFIQSMRLSDVQDQVQAQNQVNAVIQQNIASLQQYEQLQTDAQQQEQLLAAAYAGEVSYSQMLLDVSKVIPSDTYLTTFASTLPGAHRVLVEQTTTTTFVGNDVVLGRDPSLRLPQHLAEPTRIGPRLGQPVDLQRVGRCVRRRRVPVRHHRRPHAGRADAARRCRNGGDRWITSALRCS